MSRAPSPARLRAIALAHQGLSGRRKLGSGLRGAEKALERLGYVQIDTISVVARAHHHTLFTRVSKYDETVPNRLVRQGRAFEYWCHAASYLPMRDYRFALPMMRAIARGDVPWGRRRDEKLRRWVLDRIRGEGPLLARDFEHPKALRSGWWDWKPAKVALEQLFMEGELMSIERQGFQKRYDLAERCLPSHAVVSEPSLGEHADHVIDRVLEAHGFATERGAGCFRRDPRVRAAVRQRLGERAASGALASGSLRDGAIVYAHPGTFDAAARRPAAVARILSPFDNAVIDRARCAAVFGFDYAIECYVPAAKRRFGYFALPVLYRDRFAGRMDCKAHRAERRFEIKALFFETQQTPPARPADDFLPAFAAAVADYAAFAGCDAVTVGRVFPAGMASAVRTLLQ